MRHLYSQLFSGAIFPIFFGGPTKNGNFPKKGSIFSRVTEQLSTGTDFNGKPRERNPWLMNRAQCDIYTLSCSVAPFVSIFFGGPTKNGSFSNKGSIFSRLTEQLSTGTDLNGKPRERNPWLMNRAQCDIYTLSCSVAPFFSNFFGGPTKNGNFPKKGSIFSRVTEQLSTGTDFNGKPRERSPWLMNRAQCDIYTLSCSVAHCFQLFWWPH